MALWITFNSPMTMGAIFQECLLVYRILRTIFKKSDASADQNNAEQTEGLK